MPAQFKFGIIAILSLIGGITLWAMSPLVIVGAGERGVVLKWGAVQDAVLGEGIHWRTPISTSIEVMDVKVKKVSVKADAASKDLQTVTSHVVLNYHPNPAFANKLYQDIGIEYEEKVVHPAIQEIIKAVAANYTAEELITKREKVSTETKEGLRGRLKESYLAVDNFAIVNFEFSTDFNKAIESKQTAEQLALKAARDLDRIKLEAQQTIESAKAEAMSLQLQKEQITDKMIALRQIEVQAKAIAKWNGVLPTWIMGGSDNMPIPFIQIQK